MAQALCYSGDCGRFTDVDRGGFHGKGSMRTRPAQLGHYARPGRAIAMTFSRARRWIVAPLSCAFFLLVIDEASAMGKKCLFSAVTGVVLDHGKPVEGAVIERSYEWSWKNQKGGDQAATDAEGAFSLPVIWGRSLSASLLPHEPNVRQTLLITYQGKTYDGWFFNKGDYRENDELGRPIRLVCRLESEPQRRGEVFGICEPQ